MEIKTPRGRIYINNATMRSELKWSPSLKSRINEQYGTGGVMQVFIDQAVLDGCKRYIPFYSGILMESGNLGTETGSGVVRWIAPYARYLYYGNLMVGVESRSSYAKAGEKKELVEPKVPLKYGYGRGPKWFEKWKSDNLSALLDEIKQKFGVDTGEQ